MVVLVDTHRASLEWAQSLADEFGFELTDALKKTDQFYIHRDDAGRLALSRQGSSWKPLVIDFATGSLAHRLRKGVSKKDLFARALGAGKGYHSLWDVTAGLGADAAVAWSMGFSVTAIERSPILFALLRDGLERAEKMQSLIERFSLRWGESEYLLQEIEDSDRPDVIYCDPMFPDRSKSALSRREMQIFQALLAESDSEQLVELALQKARHRVVVKRPRRAPPVVEGVSHGFEGKTIRYDMYLCQNG